MKRNVPIDENAEFYVRDLLDWRAGLKRLGFMPHKLKSAEQWSLYVKLGRPIRVEGWNRQMSHVAFDVDGSDSGTVWRKPNWEFGQSSVNLAATMMFGFPLKFPNVTKFKVGFRNMLGYSYDQQVSITDNDAELRRFLRWLRNLIEFFERAEAQDVSQLQGAMGMVDAFNRFTLRTVEREALCNALYDIQEKQRELNRLTRRFERQNNHNSRVKWQHRKKH